MVWSSKQLIAIGAKKRARIPEIVWSSNERYSAAQDFVESFDDLFQLVYRDCAEPSAETLGRQGPELTDLDPRLLGKPCRSDF
jgi:hypothetical protein